jgi:mRNA interferase MazF
MLKGDIVLIPFPFTDLTTSKLRPAIVLINGNSDLTVCFITTQIKWKEDTDIEIFPTRNNGIKKHSIIRLSKIATIDISLCLGKIGELEETLINDLNANLKQLLRLN